MIDQRHSTGSLNGIIRKVGLVRRVVLLSWLITLSTVLILVTAIIPEQKRVFQRNLESKARGIAVSLQNVAAGAVINEDYSSVVDYCMQLIKGDGDIAYLVMARKDGFALMSDRSGWRTDTLGGPLWYPEAAGARSAIGIAPPRAERSFHYAAPFEYSGLNWGWIHVGLSIQTYDQSVANVYRRTGLLALICVVLSLVASIGFVRPLVRPIHKLEAVVRRVAAGDLTARASIHSQDEIERLAHAFNGMTDALQHRDKILESVRFAARQLLATDDWERVIQSVLAKLGQAAGTSRALLFANLPESEGTASFSLRHQWVRTDPGNCWPELQFENRTWQRPGIKDWAVALNKGGTVMLHVRNTIPEVRAILYPIVKSLIMLPIMVRGQWWGTLAFNQCDRERDWNEAEVDSFRVAADMLGAAIEGSQTRAALREANELLEQRVLERTAELRAEIQAKEQARAKLAEAQQLLMDVSRKTGMAEVATGVLHNVGNVLNSVNVSASMISERLRRSRINEVGRLAALFQEQQGDLSGFFAKDSRAAKVPAFLLALSKSLESDLARLRTELEQMVRNIDHIKRIVVMQQSYAKVSGVTETLPVAEIVEDALRITESGLARHGIQLVRQFEPVPPILVDKHKILQVLINLIRNARQALEAGGTGPKRIVLNVAPMITDPNRIRIRVEDSGVGIAAENLTRIFSYGFTTKLGGHGFGLHMSALTAKEMGGNLMVESLGLGLGAVFTLELPLKPEPKAAAGEDDTTFFRQGAENI